MPKVLEVLVQNLYTNPAFQNFMRRLEASMKTLESVAEQIQPHVKLIIKAIDELPDVSKHAIVSMAEQGWYLDNTGMYLEDVLKFGYQINDDIESGNTQLIEHFRSRIDDLEKELIDSNPDRKDIISEGFTDHREGKYNSSILIFLSQDDGIFSNSFDGSPFNKKFRQKTYRNNSVSGLVGHLFHISTLPIWTSADEKYASIAGLNRHQVMHGKIIGYGTEENSLKAMSLLSFLNTLCGESLPSTP